MTETLETFLKLVEDQFTYGGKKYALNNERESTDVLFDKHSKNWLIGTIDKYTFRYRNLAREKDLLKIATYMYIFWLKRGFHIQIKGINDPPIDTNIDNKVANFNTFKSRVLDFIDFDKKLLENQLGFLNNPTIETRLNNISKKLGDWSKNDFSQIYESDICFIFYQSFLIWEINHKDAAGQDTDTWNEEKK